MTSTDFRTAEQLGISDEEHAALIKTIDVLKHEQITFNMGVSCAMPDYVWDPDTYEKTKNEAFTCDTNLCIGGTMKLLMMNGMQLPKTVSFADSNAIHQYVSKNGGREIGNEEDTVFTELFYGDLDYETQPKDGIAAIERFLSGNTDDPWRTKS